MNSVSPAEPAVPAVGRDINCILSLGSVTEPQAETLQAAFKELDFCSVGVHVREYGTVITTDNIVNAGFVDLSLHPLKMSLVGCVIARGAAYHNNVSTHRSGVPVDITWAVQRYGIKCAVCIPIKLAAVMSEGSTIASEHVLGTLMLGSCKLNGVTQEHRKLAESVAASMASEFADSTSNMYNNITDYVLGPMHGHPYPKRSERPLPKPRADTQDGYWLDDSDHPDDESSGSQAVPVTEADNATSSSAEDGTEPFRLSRVDSHSVATLASSLTAPFSLPESQHSMANASSQVASICSQHSLSRADSSASSVPLDRPSPQKGGASSHKHSLTNPNSDAASKLSKRNLSTAQRHVAESTEEVSRRFRQADDQRSSFSFTLPLFWSKSKRSRSDDSAHEGQERVSGSQGSATSGPKFKGGRPGLAQASHAVSYKQRKLMLNFKDKSVEDRYCLWQAQQRTKVHLLYTFIIIATATCVGYLTPSRERGPLLIWPPFLQLLPLVYISFDPNRYYWNSEVMHVLLNITKTIWAVCFGVPRLGPFLTPGRRLAIAWKCGLDCLMVSGLGELARFSTFVWVQALDLVIVATRSGTLCALPSAAGLSVQLCVGLVFASHIFITYLCVGTLVWRMDRDARQSFVRQHQHGAVSVAAA